MITTISLLLTLASKALAGVDFSRSCASESIHPIGQHRHSRLIRKGNGKSRLTHRKSNEKKDYYVGNGVSDSTGELFVEAWCDGGRSGDRCTRLKLSECFQNVRKHLPQERNAPPRLLPSREDGDVGMTIVLLADENGARRDS